MTARQGGCLCGKVRFELRVTPQDFGTCHCEMCRRWTGSALLGVTVKESDVIWHGAEHIARYQSSSWAMRAWCRECGSGLYYRVTEAGPYAEDYEIPLGLFDDPNGLRMVREIYVDHRPDSYAFVDEDGRAKLTRQDCIERYSRLDGE